MVSRFLRNIATPIRGLHQAAYWLAVFTLGAQVLALIRDRTFAHIFGASTSLDVYYAAFKIPDLIFTLVASLVSAYVLIPRIAAASHDEARTLISNAISFLLFVGGGIALIVAFVAPHILFLFFPRFVASPHAGDFIALVRLLLLQPLLLGFTGVLASVTQVHRRFIIYSLSPILYNLGIIFGALVLYPYFGLKGIGYGVIAGSVGYLLVHIPVVWRAKLLPRLTWPSWRVMGPVMHDSVPRTLALGVGSAVVFAITVLAARAGTGVISIFTFATNLEAVPLALIGSSYAVAAFPVLSELSGKEKREEFTRVLGAAGRHLVLWSLIIFSLVVVLRAHLVRVILGTGHFNWDDTRLTAAALAILVVGLAAQGLTLLLMRALYAARQSWRPFFYQLAGGFVSVGVAAGGLYYLHRASDVLFMLGNIFRVGDVPGKIVLLFALAVVLGQLVTVAFLMGAMRRAAPGFNRALLRPAGEGIVAATGAGAATYMTLAALGNIAPLSTLPSVFAQGLIAGIVGLIVAGSTLALLKNREFRAMRLAAHRFIKKRRALPTFDAS